MAPFKTIVFLLSFALLAVLIFLYLLFPEEAVKAFIDDRLTGIDPSLSISAEAIRPAIPLAVNFDGVDLRRNSDMIIHVDQVRLAPALSTLFLAQKRFECKATVADGTVDGRIFMEGSITSGKLRAEADLSSIRLETIEALKSLSRFTLAGPLSGRLTHNGARPPMGQVNGLLRVPGLTITLKEAVYGIAQLTMDQTEAEFSLNGKALRIKAFTFNGPLLDGRISGTVELDDPFGRSQLRLNANVTPRPELFARLQDTLPKGLADPRLLGTRGLNFRVFGTIDNPEVSMR